MSTTIRPDTIEVACPNCEQPAGAKCEAFLWGTWMVLRDFHPERERAADLAAACPECGSTEIELVDVSSTSGEATEERCDACKWTGDPY